MPHVYFEASSVIIAFILLGRMLEERAKGQTTNSIKKLMGLQPRTVTLVHADGTMQVVGIDEVKAGDMLVVKPGERIAVDGKVTEGNSYVDESMLSGEPVPVWKKEADNVYAGTINQKGSFVSVLKRWELIRCWHTSSVPCKRRREARHRYRSWLIR